MGISWKIYLFSLQHIKKIIFSFFISPHLFVIDDEVYFVSTSRLLLLSFWMGNFCACMEKCSFWGLFTFLWSPLDHTKIFQVESAKDLVIQYVMECHCREIQKSHDLTDLQLEHSTFNHRRRWKHLIFLWIDVAFWWRGIKNALSKGTWKHTFDRILKRNQRKLWSRIFTNCFRREEKGEEEVNGMMRDPPKKLREKTIKINKAKIFYLWGLKNIKSSGGVLWRFTKFLLKS